MRNYTVGGYVVVVMFVLVSTLVSEVGQIASDTFPRPFIIRYVNDCFNMIVFIIPLIWRFCPTRSCQTATEKHARRSQSKSKQPATGTNAGTCRTTPLSSSRRSDSSPAAKTGCNADYAAEPITRHKTQFFSDEPQPVFLCDRTHRSRKNHEPVDTTHKSSLKAPDRSRTQFIASATNEDARLGLAPEPSKRVTLPQLAPMQSSSTISINSNFSAFDSKTLPSEPCAANRDRNPDCDSIDKNAFLAGGASVVATIATQAGQSSPDGSIPKNATQVQAQSQANLTPTRVPFNASATELLIQRHRTTILSESDNKISMIVSSMRAFLLFVAVISIFNTGGGMLWYLSLEQTTVPTNSSLSRFRALFVFIFSAIFFKETVNLWKIVGILVCLGAVVCFALEIASEPSQKHQTHRSASNGGNVTFGFGTDYSDTLTQSLFAHASFVEPCSTRVDASDAGGGSGGGLGPERVFANLGGENTNDTWLGCCLCLFVSLLWAMADIAYRIMSNNCYNPFINRLVLTSWFNTVSGLFICVTFCWVFWVRNSPFLLPIDTSDDIAWVAAISVLNVIANILQYLSLSLTSPFFLNVAMFLKIPLSFAVDVYVHNYHISYLSVTGGLLVITGFLMLEVVKPPNYDCCLCTMCRTTLCGSDLDFNEHKLQTQRKFMETYGYYGDLATLMRDMSLYSYVMRSGRSCSFDSGLLNRSQRIKNGKNAKNSPRIKYSAEAREDTTSKISYVSRDIDGTYSLVAGDHKSQQSLVSVPAAGSMGSMVSMLGDARDENDVWRNDMESESIAGVSVLGRSNVNNEISWIHAVNNSLVDAKECKDGIGKYHILVRNDDDDDERSRLSRGTM